MDGTIIENETLNDIANFLGKGDQVKKITDLGLKGRLDFSTSLENRVHLLKGLRLSSLEEAKRIVTFKKGAKKLFKVLKENGLVFQSQVAYLIPIFAVILGYVFLNELITFKVIIALIAIVIGIFIVKKSTSSKKILTQKSI